MKEMKKHIFFVIGAFFLGAILYRCDYTSIQDLKECSQEIKGCTQRVVKRNAKKVKESLKKTKEELKKITHKRIHFD